MSNKESVVIRAQNEISELARTAIIALVIAFLIRTFLFEPFSIPSGSMKPTLLEGDYLFVSKLSYGYGPYTLPFGILNFEGRFKGKLPEQGDVAVFKLPTNTSIDYIKRIVGMPGDTIQVIQGRLYINGKRLPREAQGYKNVPERDGTTRRMMSFIETLPNGVKHTIYEESDYGPLDNTPHYTVPEGHYFFMGDNRDNSQDSRVMGLVGFVPYENLVGKAENIFLSLDIGTALWEIWEWPFNMRYSRIFDSVEDL